MKGRKLVPRFIQMVWIPLLNKLLDASAGRVVEQQSGKSRPEGKGQCGLKLNGSLHFEAVIQTVVPDGLKWLFGFNSLLKGTVYCTICLKLSEFKPVGDRVTA